MVVGFWHIFANVSVYSIQKNKQGHALQCDDLFMDTRSSLQKRKQFILQAGGPLNMGEGVGFLRLYFYFMFCAFLRLTAGQFDMPHGMILKIWSESRQSLESKLFS